MNVSSGLLAALVASAIVVVGQAGTHGPPQQTQAPPQQTPAGGGEQTPPTTQQPPQGRGQGRGRGQGPGVFPAQQRELADAATIERGKALYALSCASCHGADLRGGQLGGPNLLRSQVVLNDQHGELMLPIVRGSRADKGMPPLPLPEGDVRTIAEFIHSVIADAGRQGAPPPSEALPPNILVGDAAAGQAYFAARCSSCHSPAGDLQGIATRIPDPKALQNLWVSGGVIAGRGGRGPVGMPARKPVTATVSFSSGEKITGRLVRIDHFLVTLALEDGRIRSVRREGGTPNVEIHDPVAPHRALLATYTEKDVHDVTAYLVTLK